MKMQDEMLSVWMEYAGLYFIRTVKTLKNNEYWGEVS